MLILLVLLIFFAALGVPLAFAIGASCVSYILIYAPNFIAMLPQRVWNGAYSELMIAMPLFMLAGELMNTGGITQRIINYLIVLAVVLVFTYQGFKYVGVAGKQISQGMEIPMMYMYGIMPVCGIICAICVVIKIITLYKADISYFAPKNQALSRDDA